MLTDHPSVSCINLHYVKPEHISAARGESEHYWLKIGPVAIHVDSAEQLLNLANQILTSVQDVI